MRFFITLILLSSLVIAGPSYCEGCVYQDKCISYKSQVSAQFGTLYCSENSVLYPAKNDLAECANGYECLSFECKDSICYTPDVSVKETPLSSNLVVVLLLVIILFIFLLFYAFAKRKRKEGKQFRKNDSAQVVKTVKLRKISKKYSPFQNLDEELKKIK